MANNSIGDMMQSVMDKVHTMVDSDTVVGTPITTPEGTILIPISRLSFGFASGGSDKGQEAAKGSVWGGSGAAFKVDPIGFLLVKDGTARMVSIQPPAYTTAERVIDMVPEVIDKIESLADKYGKKAAPAEASEPSGEPAAE